MTIIILFKCDNCFSNKYIVDSEDEIYFQCEECGKPEKVFKEDDE